MQHDALAHTEDFGRPDHHVANRPCLPGRDAPYEHYALGKPYDEMFTRDGAARPPYQILDQRLSTLSTDELVRRQQQQ